MIHQQTCHLKQHSEHGLFLVVAGTKVCRLDAAIGDQSRSNSALPLQVAVVNLAKDLYSGWPFQRGTTKSRWAKSLWIKLTITTNQVEYLQKIQTFVGIKSCRAEAWTQVSGFSHLGFVVGWSQIQILFVKCFVTVFAINALIFPWPKC